MFTTIIVRTHPHPLFLHQSPYIQVTIIVSYDSSVCMFPLSPLLFPLLKPFFPAHLLAQTASALTRGHPMLSLSNYLTNHSETALISACCSVWLNAGSLGGLSGKLWYTGVQRAMQADKGEQQPPCRRTSETPRDT